MCNWAYQWYQSAGKARTREPAYIFWSYVVHRIGCRPRDAIA